MAKEISHKEIVTPNNTHPEGYRSFPNTKIVNLEIKSREVNLVPVLIISFPVELRHITHVLSDEVTFKLTRFHF
jgi:hypothetical protein